jgi:hypothetical protein
MNGANAMVSPQRAIQGVLTAAISFGLLGSVSALWDNPLFMRMTPAGDFEIGLLLAMSVLLGAYVAIRRPFCSMKFAGGGSVIGFIGIACPVCNKVLLLLFGGELLLTYFEPVRIYVALAGTLMLAGVLVREWQQRRAATGEIANI